MVETRFIILVLRPFKFMQEDPEDQDLEDLVVIRLRTQILQGGEKEEIKELI